MGRADGPRTLTRDQRDGLMLGPDFPTLRLTGDGFADDSERRKAWAIHGAALIAERVRERPCSRPWGWWKFTADHPNADSDGFHLDTEAQLVHLIEGDHLDAGEIETLREAIVQIRAGESRSPTLLGWPGTPRAEAAADRIEAALEEAGR